MTREQQREYKRQKIREQRRREREAWEAARGPMDLPFLLLALILLVIGLIMLLSASFPSAQASESCGYDPLYYFKRQGAFALLGLFAMFWVSKINYQRFRGLARIAIVLSFILLILTPIPGIGIWRNGARRWLGVPGTSFQFQPSELAKLGIIVYFSASIAKKREKMLTFKNGILPYGLMLMAIAVLMALEPHASGMVLLVGIGAVMLVVGGIDWRWVAAGLTAGVAGGYLLLFTDLMEKIGYNSDRITTWRDAFWDPTDKSFQMAQSLIAIGSWQPEMREIPEAIWQATQEVFLELPFACQESGDLSQPLASGALKPEGLRYFGDYLLAKGAGSPPALPHTRYFKSVGMAVFDAIAARNVYLAAREKGLGQVLD